VTEDVTNLVTHRMFGL